MLSGRVAPGDPLVPRLLVIVQGDTRRAYDQVRLGQLEILRRGAGVVNRSGLVHGGLSRSTIGMGYALGQIQDGFAHGPPGIDDNLEELYESAGVANEVQLTIPEDFVFALRGPPVSEVVRGHGVGELKNPWSCKLPHRTCLLGHRYWSLSIRHHYLRSPEAQYTEHLVPGQRICHRDVRIAKRFSLKTRLLLRPSQLRRSYAALWTKSPIAPNGAEFGC
jgi:hypothetical protein